jgi:hypothetical protein
MRMLLFFTNMPDCGVDHVHFQHLQAHLQYSIIVRRWQTAGTSVDAEVLPNVPVGWRNATSTDCIVLELACYVYTGFACTSASLGRPWFRPAAIVLYCACCSSWPLRPTAAYSDQRAAIGAPRGV